MTREDKEEMGRLRRIIRDQIAVVKMQDKELERLRKLDQNYEDSVREDYEHANSKLIAISNILREIK